MRTRVERDDTRTVIELLKEYDISRRLNNLNSPLIEHPRNAAEKTTSVRIDVLPFRQLGVVLEDICPPRPRPGLVRNPPVRRIDDQTGFVRLYAAQKHVERVRSCFDVVRREPSLVCPESLHIRLPVRRSRRVPRGALRRSRLCRNRHLRAYDRR